MPVSTPAEIRALMWHTIEWEPFLGFDGHAEPSYGPVQNLKCWIESHGLIGGGVEVFRFPNGTVVEPQWDVYCSGDDPMAQKIQLYDRFTPGGVSSESLFCGVPDPQKLQAVRVGTVLGPPFDSRNPWVILVTL